MVILNGTISDVPSIKLGNSGAYTTSKVYVCGPVVPSGKTGFNPVIRPVVGFKDKPAAYKVSGTSLNVHAPPSPGVEVVTIASPLVDLAGTSPY